MKQQQLTFDKGITNVPSDPICSDNTLEKSLNLYFDGADHRPIQAPALHIGANNTSGMLIFVHHTPAQVNYLYNNNGQLTSRYLKADEQEPERQSWEVQDGIHVITGTPTIQAVGNIIILADDNGLHYILWQGTMYEVLGDRIPEPAVDFYMVNAITGGELPVYVPVNNAPEAFIVRNSQPYGDIVDLDDSGGIPKVKVLNQQDYNNLVTGLYAKNQKQIAEKKAFCEPFFVSFALELYDGSYYYNSVPVLLFPSVRHNSWATFYFVSGISRDIYLYTVFSRLFVKAKFDYSKWSDIVKDVVVFITDGIPLYDVSNDQVPRPGYTISGTTLSGVECCDRLAFRPTDRKNIYRANTLTVAQNWPYWDASVWFDFLPLNQRTDDEILNGLRSASIFYRAFSLGINRDDTQYYDAANYIESHILENITSQPQLPIDFFSRSPLSASYIKAYNSRLHLANVTRGFPRVAQQFMPYFDDISQMNNYNFAVTVKCNGGTVTVNAAITVHDTLALYFYYPDPRATNVSINGTDVPLTQHSGLNGAFALTALPSDNISPFAASATSGSSSVSYASQAPVEHLQNYLYVSDVNNPFVFRPLGVVAVGTGVILGMASLTTALSQGQFGQYPLIVFTSQGIWSLQTAATGYYTAAHPMSREVLSVPQTITETDGAVFFVSKKGLMRIIGADVACVSTQLSGKDANAANFFDGHSFVEIFNNPLTRIAYDYRDSLLWIFNPITGFEEHAIIYAIKSATFSAYDGNPYGNVVSDYPDTLIQQLNQSDYGAVFSLLNRPDINADTKLIDSATLVSRPLKLEDALALKTIIQVKHIHHLHALTTDTEAVNPVSGETEQVSTPNFSFAIEATNNLEATNDSGDTRWCPVTSLRSYPWKYYRFTYTFSNLLPTDTFSGTVLITDTRRTNKLR